MGLLCHSLNSVGQLLKLMSWHFLRISIVVVSSKKSLNAYFIALIPKKLMNLILGIFGYKLSGECI